MSIGYQINYLAVRDFSITRKVQGINVRDFYNAIGIRYDLASDGTRDIYSQSLEYSFPQLTHTDIIFSNNHVDY